MRFDRSSAGTISPPLIDPKFDRPAYYSQFVDGAERFFDAHGVWIEPGVPAAPGTRAATSEPDPVRQYSPRELIKAADKISWSLFQKEAQRILGPECPAGKQAIIDAIDKHLKVFEAKKEKKGGRRPQNDASNPAPDPDAGEEEAVTKAKAEPATGGIDLAAWGRGDTEYRMAEVRKEIRRRFSVQVQGTNERADAVDILVKEKIITASQARQDV